MTGARPMLISSMSSTRGSCMRARATASICCSPPDRFPAVTLRRLVRAGNRSNALSSGGGVLAPGRLEVVVDGQGGEQGPVVGDEHEPGARGGCGPAVLEDLPVDGDRAPLRGQQASQRAEEGGLAGAVGAEDGDHRAGGGGHVERGDDGDRAVAGLDAVALEHGPGSVRSTMAEGTCPLVPRS